VTQGTIIHRCAAAGTPARLASLFARARGRLHGDAGFTLIEVIVSSALLAVVTLGVYAGLDGATATSAEDRSRSVAAGLAQQDQDRLRATKFTDLADIDQTRTVTEGPIDYTVHSKADWISDASGVVSCTSASASLDYLRITSTVSWPALRGGRPETVETIVPPPPGALNSRGGLVVKIVDEFGEPVSGIPVTTRGPASRTVSTNDVGCAFFSALSPGAYTAEFSRTGWVDRNRQDLVTIPATVSAGQMTVLPEHQYAPAARIDATFDTVDRSGTRTFTGAPMMVEGAALAAPVSFSGGTTGATLFPDPGGYSVYAGDCAAEKPSSPIGVSPERASRVDVVLRMPTVRVDTRPGARVLYRTPGTGCSWRPSTQTDEGDGVVEHALPYGTWTICAEAIVSGTWYRSGWQSVNNNSAGGTSILLDGTTGATAGRC
jgi:prepilin-type N-terminal cleavage/methylation domain-containing protein